ncbi:MAG TPA: hypothetical protein PLP07_13075, partial [Pyrinomonadaceae bacterium]|nr:hypothetical protein [Pyrinomonadaceae bacterium]
MKLAGLEGVPVRTSNLDTSFLRTFILILLEFADVRPEIVGLTTCFFLMARVFWAISVVAKKAIATNGKSTTQNDARFLDL